MKNDPNEQEDYTDVLDRLKDTNTVATVATLVPMEKYKAVYDAYKNLATENKNLETENRNLKTSIIENPPSNNEIALRKKLDVIDPALLVTNEILGHKYPDLKLGLNDICMVHAIIKNNKLDLVGNDVYLIPYNGRISIVASISALRKIAFRNGKYGLGFLFTVKTPDGQLIKTDVIEDDTTKDLIGCQAILKHYDDRGNEFINSRYVLLKNYDPKHLGDKYKSNIWNKKKSDMLQKVAEAAVLRATFPETGSMYLQEEMEDIEKNNTIEDIIDTSPPKIKNVSDGGV